MEEIDIYFVSNKVRLFNRFFKYLFSLTCIYKIKHISAETGLDKHSKEGQHNFDFDWYMYVYT